MKLADNLINKYGADKVLHHAFCRLICALVTIVSMFFFSANVLLTILYPLAGSVVVFLLSVLKECIDGVFDGKDILAP